MSYYVQREARAMVAGQPYRVVRLWRLDDIGVEQGALGFTREGAARFSFLLAVPGIAMAGGYEFLKLATGDGPPAARSAGPPPSHGRIVLALRPACASCIPHNAP